MKLPGALQSTLKRIRDKALNLWRFRTTRKRLSENVGAADQVFTRESLLAMHHRDLEVSFNSTSVLKNKYPGITEEARARHGRVHEVQPEPEESGHEQEHARHCDRADRFGQVLFPQEVSP